MRWKKRQSMKSARLHAERRSILAALMILLLAAIPGEGKSALTYSFEPESPDNPSLVKLRELYNYGQYIMKGEDEYARMMLLKKWVYNRLRYSFDSPVPDLRNSLAIMDLAGRGETFQCQSFAAMYMQCALSMGWTARYIFLRKRSGEEHAAVDIWSGRHRKWIYVDPSWGLHVEERGVPLSLSEIRRRWISKKISRMKFIFSAGDDAETYSEKNFPVRRDDSELWRRMPLSEKWLAYTLEIAVIGRNNFFSHADGSGRDIWSDIYILRDKYNRKDRRWPFRHATALPEKVLFP